MAERSRFICTLASAASAAEAHRIVREVSAEMPDATHHCWAFVVGPPGSTNQVGMSDDGEPHGTAGRPMLTVLLHSGVGEIVAIVTRYYGGVKLGTGGLARAYSGTVQLALSTMPRAQRVALTRMTLTIAYPHVAAVQLHLAAFEATIVSQAYGADVRYLLDVPTPRAEALRAAVLDATRGGAQITLEESGAP